jgi:hypothetical protein
LRKFVIGALVGAVVLAVAGIAAAGTNNGVDWDLNYSATKAKASTGFSAEIDSTGTADSTGKPRAARKVTITFAPGTKFDTRVRPTCDAETLRGEEGPDGCPRGSRIGEGSAEAVTGLTSIDPVPLNIEAFNARNAILFYVRGTTMPITLTLEGKLRGRVLTVTVPKLTQPTPFGEAILTKFAVEIDRASKGRGSRRRNYATTPSSCPTGRWTTRAVFQYDDGRTTVRDTDTCRRTRRR